MAGWTAMVRWMMDWVRRATQPRRLIVACAVLLLASGLASWEGYEARAPGGTWERTSGTDVVDPGPGLAVFVLGAIVLAWSAVSWVAGPSGLAGRLARVTTLGCFALVALLTVVGEDALRASLGLGEWSGRGLGGTGAIEWRGDRVPVAKTGSSARYAG